MLKRCFRLQASPRSTPKQEQGRCRGMRCCRLFRGRAVMIMICGTINSWRRWTTAAKGGRNLWEKRGWTQQGMTFSVVGFLPSEMSFIWRTNKHNVPALLDPFFVTSVTQSRKQTTKLKGGIHPSTRCYPKLECHSTVQELPFFTRCVTVPKCSACWQMCADIRRFLCRRLKKKYVYKHRLSLEKFSRLMSDFMPREKTQSNPPMIE